MGRTSASGSTEPMHADHSPASGEEDWVRDDRLDRAIQTRSGFYGLVLTLIGGLVFAGAFGGLMMSEWQGTIGYTLSFIGMCLGVVGVMIIGVVAGQIDESD